MRGAVPLIGLALAAAPLAAQNECSGLFDPALRPGCELAVDAYHTAQRVGGIAISGGDPEPGAIGVLGGLGRAFASVRVTGVSAAIPNPDGSQRAISGLVPASVVTGGFGIFRGLRGGLLAVDLLGSATLLPGTIDKLAVDKSATRIGGLPLGIGYGARIGITSGKFPIPAVSVSVMRRTLPRLYFGDLASGDHYAFDSDLKATNVRITAGMRLLALDVAAGIGFDHYSSTAHLRWGTYGISTAEMTLPATSSPRALFADAGLTLPAGKLVGEIGYQTGSDVQLGTNYSGFDPKAGHVFGGLGFRFGF